VVNVSWFAKPWHYYCVISGKFLVHVIGKFRHTLVINHRQQKATDNAAFSFTMGRHSLLVLSSNSAVASNAAANRVAVGI
jgi:hypothetical protein